MLPTDNEKVPGFRRWGYWYGLVIGFLALLILLFYLITKYYA